jgi:predicted CXXCH cytochrome family protein
VEQESRQSFFRVKDFRVSSTAIKKLAVFFALASLVMAFGCEPKTQSQYKTLSFFFDGVPDPARRAAEELKKEQEGRESGRKTKSKQAQHGPFEAKMCDACHQKSTNALVLPINQLCFKCHTLDIDKKYIHGPVAAGGCRVCHSPHGSGQPFLLVAKPEEFCFYCHNKEDIYRNQVHSGLTVECTACHDAHSSNDWYLSR